ncbi:MAG: hypothetical protein Q8L48_40030 [Archangium sp.]|nr:hypothetical protein [Archangium sp.]
MRDETTPGSVGRVFLFQLCALLWPILGGVAALALLALVAFGMTGGHYGELALLFYGPVALGLLLVAALLRAGATRLKRPGAISAQISRRPSPPRPGSA